METDDLTLYAEIGAIAVADMESGAELVAAYDAATAAGAADRGITISEARSRTSVVGRAHRDAITACSG